MSVGKLKARRIWRRKLLEEQGDKCAYCPKKLNLQSATIDHYIPRSAGGPDVIENAVVACRRCNRLKSNIVPNAGNKWWVF